MKRIVRATAILATCFATLPQPADAQDHLADRLAALEEKVTMLQDRLEILEVLGWYADHWDNGRPDKWLDLFTDDIVLVEPPARFEGKEHLKKSAERNEMFRERGMQRRRFITAVVFKEQTAEAARISANVLLTNTTNRDKFDVIGTGTYDAYFVKGPAGWKIAEWTVNLDRPLDVETED